MIKFKYLLLIAFSLAMLSCTSTSYDAYDGHNFIKNAEKAVQKNDIASAEAYLKKAEKSDYGFCGNSWIDAKADISLVKAQILNKKGNYDEALQLLESTNGCLMGADCNTRDSLKIETLFLKHGKDKVVKAFQSLSDVDKHDNNGFESYSVYVKELAYTLTFGESFPQITYDENGKAVFYTPTDNNFASIAKAYSFYTLIEN